MQNLKGVAKKIWENANLMAFAKAKPWSYFKGICSLLLPYVHQLNKAQLGVVLVQNTSYTCTSVFLVHLLDCFFCERNHHKSQHLPKDYPSTVPPHPERLQQHSPNTPLKTTPAQSQHIPKDYHSSPTTPLKTTTAQSHHIPKDYHSSPTTSLKTITAQSHHIPKDYHSSPTTSLKTITAQSHHIPKDYPSTVPPHP